MKLSQFSLVVEQMSCHEESIRQDQTDDVDSPEDVQALKNIQVFEQQRRGVEPLRKESPLLRWAANLE